MQFPGYWVGGAGNDVEVVRTIFDETELSDKSNWQEAWQNEDSAEDHGYVDPLSMLHDISRRVAGKLTSDEIEVMRADMRGKMVFSVKSLEDLARLIQVAIPAALPNAWPASDRSGAVDDGAEVPFDEPSATLTS